VTGTDMAVKLRRLVPRLVWVGLTAMVWLVGVGCDPNDRPAPAKPASTTSPAAEAPAKAAPPAQAGVTTTPAARPPALFAAVGYSDAADPLAAAEAAAGAAVKQFRAAGVAPVAAVFLERLAGVTAADGAKIGGRIKQVVGVPTFGHGGVGTYGLTWQAGKLGDGGLAVLLLGGRGLDVKGYAVGGRIEYDYSDEPAKAAIVRQLRQAAAQRGDALARQVPALTRPGLVLVLGALHNDWHVPFMTALHKRLPAGVPIVGGVGKWDDYVYLDGRELTDKGGKPTQVGQLAVVVQGALRVAVCPVTARDKYKSAVVLEEGLDACRHVRKRLGGAGPGQGTGPALVLAFSCVTRLHDAKLPGPAEELANIRGVLGPGAAVFGCFCGGQVGTDAEGRLSVGGDRLVICGVAGVD
jgi:hypothetical protein